MKDVTIDAGKNRGVIVGMSFWLIGVRSTHVKISVVEVNEKTALAKVMSAGYSYEYKDNGDLKHDPEEFVPRPGLRFSSRSPYKDER